MEREKQDILDAERDVDELEEELWNRSRGFIVDYEELSEEELEECLNSAQNHFSYLRQCWESDYPDENWWE